MTVTYSRQASRSTGCTILRLLFTKWAASIWQLIKWELLLWTIFYLAINQLHTWYLKDKQAGAVLVSVVVFIQKRESTIMLPFLLGFFTMITLNRWWSVYELMEWPDSFASSLTAHLRTSSTRLSEAKVQVLRRNFAKYIQLAFVLLVRDISAPMLARFPDFESLNAEGVNLLNDQELKMMNALDKKLPKKWCKYWVPFQWLIFMMKKYYFVDFSANPVDKGKRTQVAYQASLFPSKYAYLHVVQELIKYRSRMGDVLSYDFVASPILAFTQAIIFAVYGNIFFTAFSRQVLDGPFSFLQIVFPIVEVGIYLSWIKCTLIMINPFGLDRDDFELEWMVARHWRVIYLTMNEPWKFFPLSTFTRSFHHRHHYATDAKVKDFGRMFDKNLSEQSKEPDAGVPLPSNHVPGKSVDSAPAVDGKRKDGDRTPSIFQQIRKRLSSA